MAKGSIKNWFTWIPCDSKCKKKCCKKEDSFPLLERSNDCDCENVEGTEEVNRWLFWAVEKVDF